MILAPTRELALQTARVVRDLGKHINLRTATLVSVRVCTRGPNLQHKFLGLPYQPRERRLRTATLVSLRLHERPQPHDDHMMCGFPCSCCSICKEMRTATL